MCFFFFFFQAEDGIRDYKVTGVQTCALPISDKLRAEIATAEKTASAGRDSVNRQLSDLEEKTKTLQTQLEELKNERVQLAQNIDEDVRERYERLFASKGDAAVVAVEHGVCTGCHMKVTTATAV